MSSSLSTQLVTGDKRTIAVKDVVEYYRSLASISAPKYGKIQLLGENTYSLTNYFEATDCDNLETITTFKVYSLQTKNSNEHGIEYIDSVRCISDLHEASESTFTTSKNGRYLARVKKPSGSKQELLEIWDRAKLLKTIDISELDIHGSICTNPLIGNFVWSPFGDQDKLLYVCQSKRPKYLSFFKELNTTRASGISGENLESKRPPSPSDPLNSARGEEFLERQNWGEKLTDAEHTIVAVLDVANNCQITTIDVDDHSLTIPSWLDNGSKIVSAAYKETPRKMGLLHMNSRPCKIMVHDWQSLNGSLVLELKSDTEAFHSIRVNQAGDKFLYLKNNSYGPHFHATTINIYDFIARTSKTLVDQSTKKSEMFIVDLPKSCFTSDDKHILFVEADHLYHHMCLFSIDNSKLSRIKFPTTGLSIMDFRYDVILASGSEINATPTLFVTKINTSNVSDVVAWHQIEDCIHQDEIDYESYKIPTADGSSFVSALLIKPDVRVLRRNLKVEDDSSNFTDPLPTIVRLHGGPHAHFAHDYYPKVVLSAKLGLQNLLINYRGSTGVSEDYTRSLCGRIGQLDVEDCMHAIRYFVREKLVDPTKLIIAGGSHGGFLACHLSCQDEFKFTSAIIQNPVVELCSVYSTSDIPDWAICESLGHNHFDFSHIRNEDELVKMYVCSPLYKADKANVPTLMLLGSKDQRVPMNQGRQWVDILRARGIETRCKVYPDGHALAKPESHADCAIEEGIWILNHLTKSR